MREYITELSKYAIAVCMALYSFESFAVFSFHDGSAAQNEADRHGIYMRQRVLIFLIQFLGFLDLSVVSRKTEYLFFYGFVQLFLIVVFAVTGTAYGKSCGLLLNNMCMLLGVGLCMISRLSFPKAQKQYVIVVLSFAAALLVPLLLNRLSFWKNLCGYMGRRV